MFSIARGRRGEEDAQRILGNVFTLLLLGSAVAFVVSLLVIRFLMAYIQKHSFQVFGWYRIALGVVVLLVWWLVPGLLK